MAATILPVILVASACGRSSSEPPPSTPSTPASTVPTSEGVAPPQASASDGWQVIGTSLRGRPIRSLTIGHGPRKVLFVGGIHGDEPEGAYTTSQLPEAFGAAGLADAVTLTIIEDVNPDGRAAGTRGNANGVDVNRNFPASNFNAGDPSNGGKPLSQPESRTLFDAIERIQPNLVLVAHAWAGRQFINFDGPAEEIANRFGAAASMPVEASSTFAPTPGSLGSYVGRDRGTPILTIEVLKGSSQPEVWDRLKPALLQAIAP